MRKSFASFLATATLPNTAAADALFESLLNSKDYTGLSVLLSSAAEGPGLSADKYVKAFQVPDRYVRATAFDTAPLKLALAAVPEEVETGDPLQLLGYKARPELANALLRTASLSLDLRLRAAAVEGTDLDTTVEVLNLVKHVANWDDDVLSRAVYAHRADAPILATTSSIPALATVLALMAHREGTDTPSPTSELLVASWDKVASALAGDWDTVSYKIRGDFLRVPDVVRNLIKFDLPESVETAILTFAQQLPESYKIDDYSPFKSLAWDLRQWTHQVTIRRNLTAVKAATTEAELLAAVASVQVADSELVDAVLTHPLFDGSQPILLHLATTTNSSDAAGYILDASRDVKVLAQAILHFRTDLVWAAYEILSESNPELIEEVTTQLYALTRRYDLNNDKTQAWAMAAYKRGNVAPLHKLPMPDLDQLSNPELATAILTEIMKQGPRSLTTSLSYGTPRTLGELLEDLSVEA